MKPITNSEKCLQNHNSPEHITNRLEDPVRVTELAPADTLRKIGLSKGMTFCDIGAGTGVFTVPAMEISTVYAVEISEQMRTILRGKNKGNMNIVDHIRDVPDTCCDAALLCTVLHELADVPDMASHIKRVLKEDGVLAIIEFHKRRTMMGPPTERRLSEEDVISVLGGHFVFTKRFDLGENLYCLIFNKAL